MTSLPWLCCGGGGGNADLGLAAGQNVDRLLLDLAEREALLAPILPGPDQETALGSGPGRITAPDRLCPPQGLCLLDHRDRDFAQALHRLGVRPPATAAGVGASEARGTAPTIATPTSIQLVLGVEAALYELLLRIHWGWEGGRDRPSRCESRCDSSG